MLAAYRARDIRVEGLRIQIQWVAVERHTDAGAVLRVVDRFAGATAVDSAGRRTPLPPGRTTTRLVTLTAPGPHCRITTITTP